MSYPMGVLSKFKRAVFIIFLLYSIFEIVNYAMSEDYIGLVAKAVAIILFVVCLPLVFLNKRPAYLLSAILVWVFTAVLFISGIIEKDESKIVDSLIMLIPAMVLLVMSGGIRRVKSVQVHTQTFF